MRNSKLIILLFLFTILLPAVAGANYIAVSSISFGPQNTSSHYMPVTFNITWQNAWKDAVSPMTASQNNDAAWVFIKYSLDGGVTWNHATLGPISGGASTGNAWPGAGGTVNPNLFSGGTATLSGTGTNLDVIVPTDNKGAFVQIASGNSGSGTINSTGEQFLWNYGGTGGNSVSDTSAATASVQVMAIEMVYVPTGSFFVGDGTSTTVEGQFCQGTTTTAPFNITATTQSSGLTLGGGGSNLGNNNASGMSTADDWNNSSTQNLPAAFPQGYNAFYMMKYDISQGQWRDFLNTLTRVQQNGRVYDAPSNDGPNLTGVSTLPSNVYVMSNSSSVLYRNGIVVTAIPSSTAPMKFGCQLSGAVNGGTDGEWVAMDYLSWMDTAAYAAWAGLRPYTELEYEKASRGPNTPVNGECAWGTSSGLVNAGAAFTSGTAGTISETTATAGANCLVSGGLQGPIRVGSFATSSTTTRTSAGASYWGILDLSGNLWKRLVTVGNPTGRLFTGSNGTGVLAGDGNATNLDWPSGSSGEVNNGIGSGLRGGAWNNGSTLARVSDRNNAAYTLTFRYYSLGARFVRTSP
jgi:formylglycine-generating enzyme required for sulfatase activity